MSVQDRMEGEAFMDLDHGALFHCHLVSLLGLYLPVRSADGCVCVQSDAPV